MNYVNEKKCNCCNMTGRYDYLELNSDGKCKFCNSFVKKDIKKLEQLIKDVNLEEGEKLGVTVSGGKDSIYMWSKLVELFGKDKIVAFTFYRPILTHKLAVENLKNANQLLESELVIVKEDDAFKRFYNNLSILLKKPDPAMVRVLLCSGCRYGITERLYLEGKKMGINKFISGASYMELAPFKEELLEAKSEKGDINEGFENGLKLYPELDFDDNLFVIRRDQKYKYKNNDTLGNNLHDIRKKYQLFDFDDYSEYIPDQIERTVKQQLGWQCSERSWHFDCLVAEFKDVFYFGILGYTELDFKYASMVRYGLMSLEESEEKIKKSNYEIQHSFSKMKNLFCELGMEELLDDLKNFYITSKYLVWEN